MKSFDFFGQKIDLLYNKDKKFKTSCGATFSFIHIALCLFLFFSLSSDMINRTNPEVISTTEFISVPGPTYLAKDVYFMMFAMQDPTWSFFIDERIYKTYAAIESHPANGSGMMSIPVPIERCTEDHLPLSARESLIAAVPNISNLYCIEKNYDGMFYLNGVFGTEGYQQFTIRIEICQNTTEEANCKSTEEIDRMLYGGFFAMHSADFIVNPNNYEKPAQMFYRNYFVPTSPKLRKEYYRYIKNSYLISDNGWITKEIENKTYATFDRDRDFFDVYDTIDYTLDATPRQLIYVEIEKSNFETYYIRHYVKIQTVLAQLGGFMNVLYIFFYFVTYPFKTKAFYDLMSNKLFNFEETETVSQKNDFNNQKKGDKVKRIVPQKIMTKKPDYDFCPKDQPVKISFWEDFWSLCKRRSKLKSKIKQRNVAVQNFLEKMDLVYVIKKFLEVEKLKILLLNQDQYHLFDFFPKPFVTKSGHILLDYTSKVKKMKTLEELSESSIISNIDKVSKAISIKKAYQNIIAKEKQDTIDRKLLSLVEDDIRSMTKEKKHIFMSVSMLKQ